MTRNHPKQKQKQKQKQNEQKLRAVKRHEWEFDPSSPHIKLYASARSSTVGQKETSQTITDATPTSFVTTYDEVSYTNNRCDFTMRD
jgi:hypothetical protein